MNVLSFIMRVWIFCIISMVMPYHVARAQSYLDTPICFNVINQAPYSVYGDVRTAPDRATPDGQQVTHQATFRLKESERTDFCTTGPLYSGNQVMITLRTLIPIFECKTRIWQGAEIYIQGRQKADGSTETWVECY